MEVVQIHVDDNDGLMTGECTAYLAHLIQYYDRFADYTVFFHDDGPRHMKTAFFNLVLKSLGQRSYDVDFLHLAHERYYFPKRPLFLPVFERMGIRFSRLIVFYSLGNPHVGQGLILK